MGTEALLERLMSVRQQLDFASGLLTKPSPGGLDSCSSVLDTAGRHLAECQPALARQAGNAEALAEAWRLRRSFVRTARLLQGAADFHLNWMKFRGAMTGGYTENGESAPLILGKRISLQG